jgi:hypothetical protein
MIELRCSRILKPVRVAGASMLATSTPGGRLDTGSDATGLAIADPETTGAALDAAGLETAAGGELAGDATADVEGDADLCPPEHALSTSDALIESAIVAITALTALDVVRLRTRNGVAEGYMDSASWKLIVPP